jgi:high-affinity iron transporter
VAAVLIILVFVWEGIASSGNPNPIAPETTTSTSVLDIGVLVFREGLECILVLAVCETSVRRVAQCVERMGQGVRLSTLALLLRWARAYPMAVGCHCQNCCDHLISPYSNSGLG